MRTFTTLWAGVVKLFEDFGFTSTETAEHAQLNERNVMMVNQCFSNGGS